MKIRIYTNTKLDLKLTAKSYGHFYTKEFGKVLLKGVDRLDDIIVNH